MSNLFIPFLSKAKKRKARALNMKERGIQKLCKKCRRDCKVLGPSGGPEIKSKFICFVFKGKKAI
jgi:hypothetical protein